eukprot:7369707-Ditylum_brightwellii.AAC.1
MRLSSYMKALNKLIFDGLELYIAYLYYHLHLPIIYPRKPSKKCPVHSYFEAGKAEYLRMYESFFGNYDN